MTYRLGQQCICVVIVAAIEKCGFICYLIIGPTVDTARIRRVRACFAVFIYAASTFKSKNIGHAYFDLSAVHDSNRI